MVARGCLWLVVLGCSGLWWVLLTHDGSCWLMVGFSGSRILMVACINYFIFILIVCTYASSNDAVKTLTFIFLKTN